MPVTTDVSKLVRRTTKKRNLRKEGHLVEREDWAEATGGFAPRLLPHERIGTGITRVGRFAKVDPLKTPGLPTKWQVAGFGFFVGLVGTTGWISWRRHGGLPDPWDDNPLGLAPDDLDETRVDADSKPTFRMRINDAMDVWDE